MLPLFDIVAMWNDTTFQYWFWKIAGVIVLVVAMIITVQISRRIFARAMKKPGIQSSKKTYLSMAKSIVGVLIYIVYIAVIISQFDGLKNLGVSLLAGSGIAVLGVSLAAQDMLSNVIGGIAISISQPFKIGDVVRYIATDTTGTIEEINLRHTVLKTFDNRRIIIPNSVVNQDIIENYSRHSDGSCFFTEFGISYTSDVDKAIEIIKQQVRSHPSFIDTRTEAEKNNGAEDVKVRLIRWDGSSVALRLWLWAKDYSSACAMQWDVLKSVKAEFEKQGIEIPYQYLNVITKEEK